MDEIEPSRRQVTFNGPLEAGIRAVALLGAAYPKAFDLQRLTALDYLLVRTNDIDGGPESLHPPTPLRSPDAEVRRRDRASGASADDVARPCRTGSAASRL